MNEETIPTEESTFVGEWEYVVEDGGYDDWPEYYKRRKIGTRQKGRRQRWEYVRFTDEDILKALELRDKNV